MIVDGYELAPQLLAEWNAVERAKNTMKESFQKFGDCYKILEDLDNKLIDVGLASERIENFIHNIKN